QEIEKPILPDGSAERRAVHVAIQLRASEPRLIGKEVIGARLGVTQILVYRSVNQVRPALGDQCHLSTRGASEIRPGVAGDGAELLDRIQRDAQNAGECRAVLLVVDVDAIEHDIGLVALAPVYRAASIIVLLMRERFPKVSDAGLNGEEAHHVSR